MSVNRISHQVPWKIVNVVWKRHVIQVLLVLYTILQVDALTHDDDITQPRYKVARESHLMPSHRYLRRNRQHSHNYISNRLYLRCIGNNGVSYYLRGLVPCSILDKSANLGQKRSITSDYLEPVTSPPVSLYSRYSPSSRTPGYTVHAPSSNDRTSSGTSSTLSKIGISPSKSSAEILGQILNLANMKNTNSVVSSPKKETISPSTLSTDSSGEKRVPTQHSSSLSNQPSIVVLSPAKELSTFPSASPSVKLVHHSAPDSISSLPSNVPSSLPSNVPSNIPTVGFPTRTYVVDPHIFKLDKIAQIDGRQNHSGFGRSFCITSDAKYIAISAKEYDLSSQKILNGRVSVYTQLANDWIPYGQQLYGEAPEDDFGVDISLSDTNGLLAVGSKKYVSLYHFGLKMSNKWSLEQKINGGKKPKLSNDGQRLVNGGNGVSLINYDGKTSNTWQTVGALESADHAAISGSGNRLVTISVSGTLKGYRYDDTRKLLVQMGQTIDIGVTNTPVSLCISDAGNVIAVGFNNHVEVYRFEARRWNQFGKDIEGEIADNNGFGYSISLSKNGARIIIGSPWYNEMRGRAVIYQINQMEDKNVWLKISQDIIGEIPMAHTGYHVAQAQDELNKKYVAIGSPYIDTDQIGFVCIYQVNLQSPK